MTGQAANVERAVRAAFGLARYQAADGDGAADVQAALLVHLVESLEDGLENGLTDLLVDLGHLVDAARAVGLLEVDEDRPGLDVVRAALERADVHYSVEVDQARIG